MRIPIRKSGRRRALAVASAVALAAGALAVALPTTPAQAQSSCDVDMTVNEWGDGNGGFTAQLTITAQNVNGWELAFTIPGASLIQGWSANWSGGPNFVATNMPWNASLGQTSIGLNGTGFSSAPTSFTLNGTTCGGQQPPPSESESPPPPPSESESPPPPPPPGELVDNPYEGAEVYVNPDWQQLAIDGGAPASISGQPTAVWLDRIGAIEQGSEGNATALRTHLENAAAMDAANGATPTVFQVVIYNLPGRDCAALASNGELPATQAGLTQYQTEYIDVIRDIMADFPDLRISAIVEIDSLPNLITNTGALGPEEPATEACNTVDQLNLYQDGIAYALNQLGGLGNVYNYVDIGHHGWLGWDDNFLPFADLVMNEVVNQLSDSDFLHGFISNVANYGAAVEPFFDISDSVGGMPIREVAVDPGSPETSGWIDWNRYIDEVSYAAAYGQEFESRFGRHVSILIDTSRNGWGGPERPTGTSTSTDPITYMNESRIDRRFHLGNWCNQAGAGIGEAPQVNPEPGIDAYIWVKPPGESDGSSELIPVGPENPNGKGFDEMCDPDYEGNPRNVFMPSGALDNAPVSGAFFQAQFDELLANAWPPLSQR